MPKLSQGIMFPQGNDETEIDEDFVESLKEMMDSSDYDFALNDIEIMYYTIMEEGKIYGWMRNKIENLKKYVEGRNERRRG